MVAKSLKIWFTRISLGGEDSLVDNKIPEAETKPLIHDFKKESIKSAFTPKVLVLLLVVVIVGVLGGYLASKTGVTSKNQTQQTAGVANGTTISKGTVIGSTDTSTFKDTAQGTLQTGGINGEGAFHLVRPGGASQNVYLTSSIVDLSKFVGKNIKVWGQTQKAQYAGWLMDVGRVEVL